MIYRWKAMGPRRLCRHLIVGAGRAVSTSPDLHGRYLARGRRHRHRRGTTPPEPGAPFVLRRVQAGGPWPTTTPPPSRARRGAILRREGLYSSLVADWRRQHRQSLLKANLGRSDGGRGGPSLSEVAKPGRERAAACQAGPGRGDHRGPGKCRALGGHLEERGARRRMTAVLDAGVDELAARGVPRKRACEGPRLRRAGHYRRRRPPLHGHPHPVPAPTERSPSTRRPRSSRRSTRNGSATGPPPRSGPPCSTKAPTWARSAPCTGSYEPTPGPRTTGPGPPATDDQTRARGHRPEPRWSWDITKLRGPHKWSWFQLYVILDVYSRYAVGWLVAPRESARLAEELIADAIYALVSAGQLSCTPTAGPR